MRWIGKYPDHKAKNSHGRARSDASLLSRLKNGKGAKEAAADVRGQCQWGRGMVLSFDGDHALVLTPDGGFERVRPCLEDGERGIENIIGCEIRYLQEPSPHERVRFLPLLRVACALTVMVIFLTMSVFPVWGPMAPGRAYAYVYVDVNPSIEMVVDAQSKVISVKPNDPEAEVIVSTLGRVRGRLAEDVTKKIVDAAVDLRVLGKGRMQGFNPDPSKKDSSDGVKSLSQGSYEAIIVISISPVEADVKNDDLTGQVVNLRNAVADELKRKECEAGVVVATVVIPEAVKESARRAGVSPGRYAIWLEACDQGIDVEIREIAQGNMAGTLKKAGGNAQKIAESITLDPDLGKLLERVEKTKGKSPHGLNNSDGTKSRNNDTATGGRPGISNGKGKAYDTGPPGNDGQDGGSKRQGVEKSNGGNPGDGRRSFKEDIENNKDRGSSSKDRNSESQATGVPGRGYSAGGTGSERSEKAYPGSGTAKRTLGDPDIQEIKWEKKGFCQSEYLRRLHSSKNGGEAGRDVEGVGSFYEEEDEDERDRFGRGNR